MKKINSKLKALEWSQQISHCKPMGIFPEAQRQLTHKSLIGFCQISNPSKTLRLSLLPVRMKKIQSNMKTLEWSQHYQSILRCSRAAYSIIGDEILMKCKLIQAFLVVLLICKYEEDPFKIESTRGVTIFLPLEVYGDFSNAQGQLTHKSLIGFCQISNPSKILWVSLLPARMKKTQSKMKTLEWSQHYQSILRCSRAANSIIGDEILMKFKLIQAYIVVLLICKYEEDPFKIESTREVTTFLPLEVYGDFFKRSRAANS